jgi:hypothetical protein
MSGSGSGSWHVDDSLLRSWVDGIAGPVLSVSVEQHMLHCTRCRTEVASLVPRTDLEPVWESVLAAVELPQLGFAERLLTRLGLHPSDSMVIASAVTLRVAWLTGMVGVLFFVVLAGLLADDGGVALFLVAAPLLPVASVAAAYGPASDPSYEAVHVTPYPMMRLVLLRTVSVLVTSVPLVVGAGLLLPTSAVVAVAWLMPAIGFIPVVLTASAWINPDHAATAVGIGWVAAVMWAIHSGDPFIVFDPAAVVLYVVLFTVASMTLLVHLLGKTPSWRLR